MQRKNQQNCHTLVMYCLNEKNKNIEYVKVKIMLDYKKKINGEAQGISEQSKLFSTN